MNLGAFESFFLPDKNPVDSNPKAYIHGMVKSSSYSQWAADKYQILPDEQQEMLPSEKATMVAEYIFEQMCLEINELEEAKKNNDSDLTPYDIENLGFNSIFCAELDLLKELIQSSVRFFLDMQGSITIDDRNEMAFLAQKFYYLMQDRKNETPKYKHIYAQNPYSHPHRAIFLFLGGEKVLFDKFTELFDQISK